MIGKNGLIVQPSSKSKVKIQLFALPLLFVTCYLLFGMGMTGQSACAGNTVRRPIAFLDYFLVVFFAFAFVAVFFAGVFFAVVFAGIFPPLYDVLYPFLIFCQEENLNFWEWGMGSGE